MIMTSTLLILEATFCNRSSFSSDIPLKNIAGGGSANYNIGHERIENSLGDLVLRGQRGLRTFAETHAEQVYHSIGLVKLVFSAFAVSAHKEIIYL